MEPWQRKGAICQYHQSISMSSLGLDDSDIKSVSSGFKGRKALAIIKQPNGEKIHGLSTRLDFKEENRKPVTYEVHLVVRWNQKRPSRKPCSF
jgi:hypothetical protein